MSLATTVWSAKPIYGPLRHEFGWPAPLLLGAGALSLAITALLFVPCERASGRHGARALCTLGCLGSGLVALLALPNLTHPWQLAGALVLLGITRAATLSACWHELRRVFPSMAVTAAAAALCTVTSLTAVAPWIARLVYLNDWREGAITCAGILLLLATPIAWVLLPGTEVEGGGQHDDSQSETNSTGMNATAPPPTRRHDSAAGAPHREEQHER